MPGPAPKSKEERRRRNPPVHEWVVLSESYDGPIPPLPGPKTGKNARWEKPTREWWETIWRTPMATQWNEGDVPGLIELAILRQAFMEGDMSVRSEVRQRADRFGLTPKGRRDLRWVITEADAERAGLPDEPLASVTRIRAVDPT